VLHFPDERAGAKLTDIQARLGHSNAATTGVYMQQLHASENAYADGVAALLGVHASPRHH
jgi:integrase